MIMKKIALFVIAFAAVINTIFAQENSNLNKIALNVYVQESEIIPYDLKNIAEVKLKSLVSANGLGAFENSNPRFFLSANLIQLSKEQLSEMNLTYYNFDLSLYVVDAFDKKIFNSFTINLKGVGSNEKNAYVDAIKKIDVNSPTAIKFIDDSKNKILEYYLAYCNIIQNKALSLAGQSNYDEAIFMLTSIPDLNNDCSKSVSANILKIYKQKINAECNTKLSAAKSALSIGDYGQAADLLAPIVSEMSCYSEAQKLFKEIIENRSALALRNARNAWLNRDVDSSSKYLSEVYYNSKSATGAEALVTEIKKWVKDKENKEWQLQLKNIDSEVAAKQASIQAAKDVALAYAKGLNRTIIYNTRGLW
jgi:hypothetical protein